MSLGPVFSVGVHILDVLGRPVADIPPGQGSVRLDEIKATAAGTAAGTSVDLARLGVQVFSCGAIGDDALGELLLLLLNKAGVDCRYVIRKLGERTSATILPIRANGERPALHAPGAAQLLDPADLTAKIFDLAAGSHTRPVLHIGGPDALGQFAAEPLQALARAAKDRGFLVTLDVLRAGDRQTFAELKPLLRICDWFMPNEDQLRQLTGETDLKRAITAARAAGPAGVAVTRGADGCSIDCGDGVIDVPAIEVPVVDTTGCGDAFDAGFITALLLGCDYEQAAWLAVACGALVATGLGSDAGLTTLEAAIAFLGASRPNIAARISANAMPFSEIPSSAGDHQPPASQASPAPVPGRG
jgi:sugar/nucleoside kinase (ribokinase family)